jgi:hypothetical protein
LTLQDAFQGTGCPNDANRFTVNADDTVTDHCTGLQWQRFAADVDGNGSADAFGWCDALSYCFDLTLAGHGDWRLPNVRELESLIDYGEFNPASNPVFRIPADQFNQYWTSTSSIVIGQAYYIDFAIGEIKKSGKDSALHVRAVRGGF